MSRNRLTETAALAGLLATGERISQQPDQTRSLEPVAWSRRASGRCEVSAAF